jgi:hypothetical protein
MEFTPNGRSMYGGVYNIAQNVQIVDAAVSSIIFSPLWGPVEGDGDQLYGLNVKWKNPLTGAKKLILQFGASEPTPVLMWRQQRNLSTATDESASQTHYYIGELTAAAANTQMEAACYFTTHREGFARYLVVESFQNDATTTLGDAKRGTYRQARWGNIADQITEIRVVVEDATAAIGIGSEFRLWRSN